MRFLLQEDVRLRVGIRTSLSRLVTYGVTDQRTVGNVVGSVHEEVRLEMEMTDLLNGPRKRRAPSPAPDDSNNDDDVQGV